MTLLRQAGGDGTGNPSPTRRRICRYGVGAACGRPPVARRVVAPHGGVSGVRRTIPQSASLTAPFKVNCPGGAREGGLGHTQGSLSPSDIASWRCHLPHQREAGALSILRRRARALPLPLSLLAMTRGRGTGRGGLREGQAPPLRHTKGSSVCGTAYSLLSFSARMVEEVPLV